MFTLNIKIVRHKFDYLFLKLTKLSQKRLLTIWSSDLCCLKQAKEQAGEKYEEEEDSAAEASESVKEEAES